MNSSVFQSIQKIVHDSSGIDLKEGKAQMVAARISQRLRELQLDDEAEYLEHLEQNADEMVQLLNVISTNVTRFFREKPHFDFTHRVVSQWLMQGQERIRFWSAASSAGQEPYSLLITIAEAARQTGRKADIRLLGTDISTRVLERAEAGEYDSNEIEGIPADLLKRYFTSTALSGGQCYQVKPVLRERAVFRRMNLNEPPFPMQGPLDMVFCCNVMIYFDANTKRRLLTEIHRLLRPDGYLIVSHTESLTGLTDLFRPVRPSIYVRSDAPVGLGLQLEAAK
jgi:chemotaxis protein methyltransferase CheR